ncbi:TfoX family protein [Microbacterium oryzae]|uniref:TfoX family protein n=3 Tax=Microbacterium oryzae TaxID=743009 RepID=A0A6I6DPI4_9MICO|nr:TfoX family protein [Microbacterium oryzae]
MHPVAADAEQADDGRHDRRIERAMTPEQTALVSRVRVLLGDEPVVREVSMFGGRSVMVAERMIASVLEDGALLVRVDADRHDELLTRPGALQAEMGQGRTMGPGWIEIAPDVLRDDEQLAAWVELALEHNRSARG